MSVLVDGALPGTLCPSVVAIERHAVRWLGSRSTDYRCAFNSRRQRVPPFVPPRARAPKHPEPRLATGCLYDHTEKCIDLRRYMAVTDLGVCMVEFERKQY